MRDYLGLLRRLPLGWLLVGAVVLGFVLGANWPRTRENEGARLRRECTEIVLEAFKERRRVSDTTLENAIGECILQRGFSGRG